MWLIAGIFQNIWNKFYNTCVRNVSDTVRGSIVVVVFLLSVISLVYAMKGGEKGKLVNNWFFFWVAVILVVLNIVYSLL